MREQGRTADPSATLGMTKKARRMLWYPTQAKTGLEWGTQPLLTVKQSKKSQPLRMTILWVNRKRNSRSLRFAPVEMTNSFKDR